MNVRILRQRSPFSDPYWEEFFYEDKENQTVAGMLDDLNYKDDLKTIAGESAPRIQWECSCLQGMCGACAMVINHRPALACETFLRDIKGDTVILEPLKKFPTVSDLVVDRSIIQENLKNANTYIEEYSADKSSDFNQMYSAAKCLKCGLCLEVCPNYGKGETFFGAAFANDCYLIASRSLSQKDTIKESYQSHFAKGCSKALSCVDICPMKIPTLTSISRMNR
ncbi:MAG: succinate dehydrogenase/fumarate reductase iron-sulfur subunit [Lachnospiraceae bacterium]|nr:succinate dehydrogenase/fumarate reductase iron-sulfur subunit [Lachnospiraceae bacterium]